MEKLALLVAKTVGGTLLGVCSIVASGMVLGAVGAGAKLGYDLVIYIVDMMM